MKIKLSQEELTTMETDILIIGCFEDEEFQYKKLDEKLNNAITKAIEKERFKGELKQTHTFSSLGIISPEQLILVGLGKKEEFGMEKLRKVAGKSLKKARSEKAKTVGLAINKISFGDKTPEQIISTVTEGLVLANYKFEKYKTQDKEKSHSIEEVRILAGEDFEGVVRKAETVAESVIYVRDLVNTAPSEATPSYMEKEAKKLESKGVKLTVLNKEDMKEKGMNAILGVSRGSSEDPKLVLMETNPAAEKKIALVGKGITFDSGGLDIKPADNMLDMKYDMAGAATVLGIVKAAAELKLPINVLGVMPLSENMPGQSAQKPGDIIKSYNKKTIEISNTDAEGRLVLADAIAYAEEQEPDAIIDLATLTGACVVALGHAAAALVSNNDNLKELIKKSADETDERVWELPLWDDFREAVKSDIADVRNIGKGKGYEAGAITAATFIENFVNEAKWAHLDIAGVAWFSDSKEYTHKGATGYGVRLLINLLEKHSQSL